MLYVYSPGSLGKGWEEQWLMLANKDHSNPATKGRAMQCFSCATPRDLTDFATLSQFVSHISHYKSHKQAGEAVAHISDEVPIT